MAPFEEIEDFFEPGQSLDEELDDEHLALDLRYQEDVLSRLASERLEKAYDEAEAEARDAGLDEPTEEMVQRIVRFYEQQEKDLPPNTR